VISSFKRQNLQHRHHIRTIQDLLLKQRQNILALHAENVRLCGKLGIEPDPEPVPELVNCAFLLPESANPPVATSSEDTAHRFLGPDDAQIHGMGASELKPSGWSCSEDSATTANGSSWSFDPSDDEDPIINLPASLNCTPDRGDYNSSSSSGSPRSSGTISSAAPSSGSPPSSDLSSSSPERDCDSSSTVENICQVSRSQSILSVPVSPPRAQPQPISDSDGPFAFKYRRKPCRASILGRSKRSPSLSTLPCPFPRCLSSTEDCSIVEQIKEEPSDMSPPCAQSTSSKSVCKSELSPMESFMPLNISITPECYNPPPVLSSVPLRSCSKRSHISAKTAPETSRQKRSKVLSSTEALPDAIASGSAEDVQFEGIFLEDDGLDSTASPITVEVSSDMSMEVGRLPARVDFDDVSFALTDLQESDGFGPCIGSGLSATAFGMTGIGDELLDWSAASSSCDRLKGETICSVGSLSGLIVETGPAQTSRLASIPVRSSLGSERGSRACSGQAFFNADVCDVPFESDDFADVSLFSSVLSIDDCSDEKV